MSVSTRSTRSIQGIGHDAGHYLKRSGSSSRAPHSEDEPIPKTPLCRSDPAAYPVDGLLMLAKDNTALITQFYSPYLAKSHQNLLPELLAQIQTDKRTRARWLPVQHSTPHPSTNQLSFLNT